MSRKRRKYDPKQLLEQAMKNYMRLPGRIPWKVIREVVKLRDEYRCKGCWSTDKELEVHHQIRRPWHLTDLVSLCESCHLQEHGKGGEGAAG